MINRRKFASLFGSSLVAGYLNRCSTTQSARAKVSKSQKATATVLSTWNNQRANTIAMDTLSGPLEAGEDESARLLNALELGINSVEADPKDTSVGLGGRPDRDGHVTLDACIMDDKGMAGSVTFLEGYKHAISVARKVLEETPHVIISGSGAAQFAESQGFIKENLLTTDSRQKYEQWLEESVYEPEINIERHDTIGLLVRSESGAMAGGCSTSGLAYKMRGRVGDSPIIGAGLYVDNEVGSAAATGLGELVLRQLSSFLVVEFMRQGMSPQRACEQAIKRIISKSKVEKAQVALIAMNKAGETGGYSIHPGFVYVLTEGDNSSLIQADSYL